MMAACMGGWRLGIANIIHHFSILHAGGSSHERKDRKNRCFQSHGILWILNSIIFKIIIKIFRFFCGVISFLVLADLALTLMHTHASSSHLIYFVFIDTSENTKRNSNDWVGASVCVFDIRIWGESHTCVTRSVLHLVSSTNPQLDARWDEFSFCQQYN